MIKVRRPALDAGLQDDLQARQKAVDEKQIGADTAWDEFKTVEDERRKGSKPTVLDTLAPTIKCAYCETSGSVELDHHWPKKPHKQHNQNRGTATKLFRWDNLVPACHTCNKFECKGSHMQWTAVGQTMLLNPYVAGDDPLCYFDIIVEEGTTDEKGQPWQIGWVEPRRDLNKISYERAIYTRKRLKLNLRYELLRGRNKSIQYFLDYVGYFRQFGRDHQIRKGRTIRSVFTEMLASKEPYLAPIRQILRRDQALRDELFKEMPELKSIVESWDLDPDDCSAVT